MVPIRISIVEIIGKYVKLSRLGTGYVGECPFCNSNRKSAFKVLPRFNTYSCDDCGQSGGPFKFLRQHRKCTLEEAVTEIIDTYGLPIKVDLTDKNLNNVFFATDFIEAFSQYSKEKAQLLAVKPEPPKISVSYTELAVYLRCPYEYKLRYLDKIPLSSAKGIEVKIGLFLHKLATNFLQESQKNKTSEYVHSLFKQEADLSIIAQYSYELLKFEDNMTQLLLNNFLDAQWVDKNLSFKTPFGPYVLEGRADGLLNIDSHLQIIEFKESDYRTDDENDGIVKYLQLFFYYFGLNCEKNVIEGGIYVFFNSGMVDRLTFNVDKVREAAKTLQLKIEEMLSTKVFSPTASRLCATCGCKESCATYMSQRRKTHEGT